MILYRHARFAHLTGRRHHSNDTACQDASSLVLPGSITHDGQRKRSSENYIYAIKMLCATALTFYYKLLQTCEQFFRNEPQSVPIVRLIHVVFQLLRMISSYDILRPLSVSILFLYYYLQQQMGQNVLL